MQAGRLAGAPSPVCARPLHALCCVVFCLTCALCCAPQQSVVRVVRAHPYVAFLSLLAAAALMTAGVVGVLAASSAEVRHRRDSAANFANNAAVAFEVQLQQTLAPLVGLSAMIHLQPYYPALAPRFDEIASELLAQARAAEPEGRQPKGAWDVVGACGFAVRNFPLNAGNVHALPFLPELPSARLQHNVLPDDACVCGVFVRMSRCLCLVQSRACRCRRKGWSEASFP